MIENTRLNNDNDIKSDPAASDTTDEASGFAATVDSGEETAVDATVSMRNAADGQYIFDGRGRRPSNIL